MRGRTRAGDKTIDVQFATDLLQRWVNPALSVTNARPLRGGMVHEVCLWQTDGEPAALVVKINGPDHLEGFQSELAHLNWYRAHSHLPVPDPVVTFHDTEHDVTGLVMEYIPGVNLAEARLSPTGLQRLQHSLAEHVADLHDNHRDTFGPALTPETGRTRWLEVFAPAFEREFEHVRDQLSARARSIIDDLVAHLERWLPEQHKPTLIHGDLWATNILVDDSHPDRPRLLAFIDCNASYADPEYELAYLRLFQTAQQPFFQTYSQTHTLQPGFEQRCHIYWLNTMLLHVRHFGEDYLPGCEQLAQQLRQWT